jgi:hypothetical protein
LTSRCLGDGQGGVDEDLDELAVVEDLAGQAALGAERRDEGGQHDQAGVDHQLGDLGDPADVLDPVLLGEAEVAVEAVPDIVAVQQIGVAAQGVQALFDQVGDGRLARPRQARQPHHPAALALEGGARGLADVGVLPVDVVGPAQGEVDQPGPDRAVADPVDQDEPAQVAVLA